ncbi:MAG: hypothetical protein KDC53_22580 [Saprospiraceae bacterium]|nr:hypothetical protein [Saprospiraceae bacterium]
MKKFWISFQLVMLLSGFGTTHMALSQSVLFEGPANLPSNPPNPPIIGSTKAWLWYAEKGALRFGDFEPSFWEKDSMGRSSSAWGTDNRASGLQAMAWGQDNISTKSDATSWGIDNLALASQATAFGTFCQAEGQASLAAGSHLFARSYAEIALGQYNKLQVNHNPITFDSSNYIFTLGNGTTSLNRSNALEIFKNGKNRFHALNFISDTINVVVDNQMISVENLSYLKIKASLPDIADQHTLILSNGIKTGQLLYLECILNSCQFLDGSSNAELTVNHDLQPGDILHLIWDGEQWLEIFFSDN